MSSRRTWTCVFFTADFSAPTALKCWLSKCRSPLIMRFPRCKSSSCLLPSFILLTQPRRKQVHFNSRSPPRTCFLHLPSLWPWVLQWQKLRTVYTSLPLELPLPYPKNSHANFSPQERTFTNETTNISSIDFVFYSICARSYTWLYNRVIWSGKWH